MVVVSETGAWPPGAVSAAGAGLYVEAAEIVKVVWSYCAVGVRDSDAEGESLGPLLLRPTDTGALAALCCGRIDPRRLVFRSRRERKAGIDDEARSSG